ncbi:Cytochrome P450 [Amycolatopsis xylanica]|uniref:Cytochrome P450 n=1 Tax=Amycolatopsis xylanica TaxID=589385 RepID=A0A1H2V8V6_9PSEU|nr:cytochrome P450 [Amycolatopsis xylanica]SDW64743.1 Cytochrome P450 [Amycolatopsis xylanica]
MKIGDKRRLRRDPLAYLEDLHRRSTGDVIRLPWGGWCVGDADLAHDLLRDPEFNGDRSEFFGDLLPTRAAQIDVGHAVRDFLRARVPRYRTALAEAVAELPSVSHWPDAGTALAYGCLADLLLYPGTPAGTRRLLARAVDGGVVVRPTRLWERVQAEVVRGKLITAVAGQVARRREHPAAEPRDVLDVVLGACALTDRLVAEVYLTMVRAVVAPIGMMTAWSVLLACLRNPADGAWPWPVDQIVREALRFRPMPWMLGRTLAKPTRVGGVSLRAGATVSVSPYLVHHDEQRWSDAKVFRPERWACPSGHGPSVSFGAGPFTCPGASLAQVLIADTLTALTRDATLAVAGGDVRPVLSEHAIPRPFTVRRTMTDSGRR